MDTGRWRYQLLLSRQRFYLPPKQIELFRRRAAAWLVRQGRIDEAIEHLLAVRDWTEAAQLVEGQLCALLNAEDFHAIKQRLGYFSEDFIATRPGLLLMQILMAHFALRLPVVHSLVIRLQSLLEAVRETDEPVEGGNVPAGFEAIPLDVVQAHVWMLESFGYVLTNRARQAASLACQAMDSLPEAWKYSRGNVMLYLGTSMLMGAENSPSHALRSI